MRFSGFELLAVVVLLFAYSYLSIKAVRLPFSMQAGFSAVFYLYIGDNIREYRIVDKMHDVPNYMLIFATMLVIVSAFGIGHITLSACNYGGHPVVQILVSIIGSLLVLRLCKIWDNCFMAKIGAWSLYLLCGHALRGSFFQLTGIDMKEMSFTPFVNFMIEIVIQTLFAFMVGKMLSYPIKAIQRKFKLI